MDECSETKLLTAKYYKAKNCVFIHFVAVPHLGSHYKYDKA